MRRKNGILSGIIAVITLAVAIFLISCAGVMPYRTVTFKNGDEQVAVSTVLSGGKISFPDVELEPGYCAQWLRPDGSEFLDSETVLSDLTLTLVPKPIEYEVIYELGGGVAPEGNPSTVTVESESFTLIPATREGAAFEGWMDKSGNVITELTPSCIDLEGEENTVVLTAKWRVTKFSVTYDPNGGSMPDNPDTYTVDDANTLLKPSVLRGYTFLGWFTPEGELVESFAGQFDELVLTARWEITRFSIVYNNMGNADNTVNPKDFTFLETVEVLAPTRYGYDFIGWMVGDSTETTKTYTVPVDTVSDVTLTAVWSAHPATLTVMVGGQQYAEIDTAFGEIFTLDRLAERREGYSVTVYFDPVCVQPVNLPYEVVAYDVTVYVFYTPISYSVKLDYGDGSVENYRVFTVESDTFSLPKVVREGFTFGGWSDGEHIYTEITAGTVGSKNLTAVWTRNSYPLVFDTMGGSPIEPLQIEYGAKIVFNVTTDCDGMRFGGWYMDPQYEKEFLGGTMPASQVTLYARWFQNASYAVNYSSNPVGVTLSGSCHSGAYIVDGSSVTLTAPYYYNGRLFVEWLVNGVSCGKNTEITVLVDGEEINAVATYKEVRGYEYNVSSGAGLSISTFSSSAYLDGHGILSSHQTLKSGALTVDGAFLRSLGTGLKVFAMTENGSVSFVYVNIYDSSPRPTVKVDFDSAFPNVILSCDIPEGSSFVYSVNGGAAKPFSGSVVLSGIDRSRTNVFTVTPVGGGESYSKTVSAINSKYAEFYNGSFIYGGKTYDLVINSEEELRIMIEYVCFVLAVTDKTASADAEYKYSASLTYIIGEDYAAEFNADKASAYLKALESMSIPYSPAYTTSSFGDTSPKGKLTVFFDELNTQVTDQNKVVIPDDAGLLTESSRPADFESFYIDSMSVTQLIRSLYELESLPFGVRPIFDSSVASQQAKAVYDAAREALRRYVDESMTDYEKAAAIYAYLGLNVTYDTKLSKMSGAVGSYRGFTSYGALIDGLAVCDGYASAYRIMCLIEGIPCVEIIGTSNGMGHAWNKVYIEGTWYGVDSTWSRVGTKYLTHRYLLINEAQLIESGHVENAGGNGETYIGHVAAGEEDYYGMNGAVINDASDIKRFVNEAAAEGVTVIELKNLSGKTIGELFNKYNLSDFNVASLSYSTIDGTDIVYIFIELK